MMTASGAFVVTGAVVGSHWFRANIGKIFNGKLLFLNYLIFGQFDCLFRASGVKHQALANNVF